MTFHKEKQVALAATKKAGAELLKQFNRVATLTIKTKSKHEIITPADLASEKIILSAIKKSFPAHHILSEEAGQNKIKSDYIWIVDPLDGTTNFAMGNPLFSISIALAYKKEIILGLIYAPYLKELYFAEKGKGAYLNGQKIRVSPDKELKKSFITYCMGSDENSTRAAIKISGRLKIASRDARQIGSAAIEHAWVARGRTAAIIIPGTKPWDVAAGALLVREAGGTITDFLGREWQLTEKNICSSNGMIHQELLQLINNTTPRHS